MSIAVYVGAIGSLVLAERLGADGGGGGA